MLYLQQSGSPANTKNKNKHGFGIKYIVRYENTPSDINDITNLNGNAINRVKKRKEKDYSQGIFTTENIEGTPTFDKYNDLKKYIKKYVGLLI